MYVLYMCMWDIVREVYIIMNVFNIIFVYNGFKILLSILLNFCM